MHETGHSKPEWLGQKAWDEDGSERVKGWEIHEHPVTDSYQCMEKTTTIL